MADVFSIEDANKIRVAMGQKPLPVSGTVSGPIFEDHRAKENTDEDAGSTLESREAAGYGNWKRLQEEKNTREKREAQKEVIKKARDAAQRNSKMDGKGLGEADEEGGTEMDTRSWLLQQKKRQRQIEKARKLEEELAIREAEALAQKQYTAADLAGVKIGHEMGEFDSVGQVLILKDAPIDDADDDNIDELEATELKEKEMLKERLESKKRRPVYDPNNVDEDGKTTLLSQYDEEIEGKKRNCFTLDVQGNTKELMQNFARENAGDSAKVKIDLNSSSENVPISDYADPPEIKIRKPKKSKSRRKKNVEDQDIFLLPGSLVADNGDTMDLDKNHEAGGEDSKKRTLDNSSLLDDEDLQASLALQRRQALKKRKRMRPEDLARQVHEEESELKENASDDPPGLVIDETSEFVANLQKPGVPKLQEKKFVPLPSQEKSGDGSLSPDAEGDIHMGQPGNEIADEGGFEHEINCDSQSNDIPTTGLEEEPTLNHGLGTTLSLLNQRGLIKDSISDSMNDIHRRQQTFIEEKHKLEAEAERVAKTQRERDRQSGRLDRMSNKEKEDWARYNNVQREQLESRKMAEIFNRDYKPSVELTYIDEFGRHMNKKEAFKNLSHQFHGKVSGKQKMEKRLKQIEEEKKREAMSSLDSSQNSGMNHAQGATARKNRQAGVRLQ